MEKPNSELINSSLTGDLSKDVETLKTILNYPVNKDIVYRDFKAFGFDMCLLFVDGMASAELVGKLVLHAIMPGDGQEPGSVEPEKRASFLQERIITVAQVNNVTLTEKLLSDLMAGMSILLIDGCSEVLSLETRGFEKRNIERTQTESVLIGSQEGFVENLRTNVTLMHRYLQSEQLITEYMNVGTKVPTQIAIMYLNGVVEEKNLTELKRRLNIIESATLQSVGQLEQLIEDSPYALLPQMLQTERPDRTTSCLLSGQIAVFVNNSPYALVAPVSVFDLLHASDDTFMRWQYGSLLRLIRTIGIFLSLFLPGLYVALTLFHPHLIPMPLLTSIAETRANVPFSVVFEIVIMEASFYLINEAGTRIPSQIGTALGIVGALVLGQAAVAASIISPILIIIIALTGLGNYAIPNYSFSVGILLYRFTLIIVGSLMGLFGIAIMTFLYVCHLCSMNSLGVPYLAPVAPLKPHNPDILLRMPMKMQTRTMFLAKKNSWIQKKK